MARINVQPKAKRLPAAKPTVAGFLAFGSGDLLPQTLKDVIDDSDTASAAIEARAEFIIGNGLFDENLADYVVNRHGETFDDIVEGTGWNMSEGEAIVLWIGYNGNLEPNEIRVVPWEMFRFKEPDESGKLTHGAIFPYLSSTYKKDKDKRKFHTVCPLFNDDKDVVQAQIQAAGGILNYTGQLLYIKAGKPSADYYAIPSYFGSVKNLETEKESVDGDFATIANGLATSGFWKQLKTKPKVVTLRRRNADGEWEDYEEEVEDQDSIVVKIQENQGGENMGSVMVVEAESVEELDAMDFVPVTGADVSNRYSALSDRVAQRIARRMRTPNEIINLRRTGGLAPTGDEMKVGSQMMQQSVNKKQRKLEQILMRVTKNWHEPLPGDDFHIENLNYFTDGNSSSSVAQPN